VGLRSVISPRRWASTEAVDAQRREEARVEAQRLFLRRDPVREVDEPIGGQPQPFRPDHTPEGAVVGLAGPAILGDTRRIQRDRPPRAVGRQQQPGLLEGLADGADPVAERGARCVPQAETARRVLHVEAAAPGRRVLGVVVRLDLAAREHEVARGELALEVPPHQQALHAAAGAVAQEDERRGGGRNGGRRFDGHGVVCHDARAVVMSDEEA